MTLDDLARDTAGSYFYLASPYSKWTDGIDDACWTIAKLAGRVLARGVTVYSPIVHSHVIARAGNIDPWSHDFWLPHDKPIAHAACGILVAGLPGWRESFGIGEELKWFAAAGKPLYLLDPATLAVEWFSY